MFTRLFLGPLKSGATSIGEAVWAVEQNIIQTLFISTLCTYMYKHLYYYSLAKGASEIS